VSVAVQVVDLVEVVAHAMSAVATSAAAHRRFPNRSFMRIVLCIVHAATQLPASAQCGASSIAHAIRWSGRTLQRLRG
jgi:hypothetical protein